MKNEEEENEDFFYFFYFLVCKYSSEALNFADFKWAFPEKNFTPTVEDIDFSKYRTPWISYFISKEGVYIHS